MRSNWYRIGDFYHQNPLTESQQELIADGRCCLIRSVKFRNPQFSVLVSEIEVRHFSDGDTQIELRAPQTSYDELRHICMNIFDSAECTYGMSSPVITIKFNTGSNYKHLLILLNFLKDKDQKNEITLDIINEFISLSVFLHRRKYRRAYTNTLRIYEYLDLVSSVENKPTHMIPTGLFANSHENPARKHSKALTKLFNQHAAKEITVDRVEVHLINGENPNQSDEYGRTLLHKVWYCPDIRVFKRMLQYGANPFIRENGMWSESAWDMAHRFKHVEILNAIISHNSPLQRPLNQPNKIAKIDLSLENQKIVTHIYSSDEKFVLSTSFKKMQQLSEKEKDLMYIIFSEVFSQNISNDSSKLKQIFEEYISGENKFIEIIYNSNNKIIGFNMLQLVYFDKYIFAHTLCSVIMKEHRGNGLNSFLIYRPAFSLQLVAADKQIGILFCAIDINSFRIVENLDFDYYPKYQPKHIDDTVIRPLLNRVFDGKYTFVHKGLECFVEDEIEVKSTHSKSNSNMNLVVDLFERMTGKEKSEQAKSLEDKKNPNSGSTRAIPVVKFVTKESYRKLNYEFSKLGISFYTHTTMFSQALRYLLKDDKNIDCKATSSPELQSVATVFWIANERRSKL